MPTVTIAPSITRTQTSETFQFAVVFDVSDSAMVTGFSIANLLLRDKDDAPVSIDGLTFALVDTTDTDNNQFVQVTLPVNRRGEFRVRATGSVMVDSMSGMLSGISEVIRYDTRGGFGDDPANVGSGIPLEFGEIVYSDDGTITVPVRFYSPDANGNKVDESIIAPQRSIFRVERVSGDQITDFEYHMIGQGANYDLEFQPVEGRKGSYQIIPDGMVFVESSQIWLPVKVDTVPKSVPKLIAFGYC